MATSWPLIEAMRRCAYVPFEDTLEDGDVIKCKCCQQEFPDLTKKDLQANWGDAYECVHCKSYICPECWNVGYDDVPGTPDRDHNQSEQRAYISFAFAYSHVRPLREQETGLAAYLLGLPARPP